MKVRAEDRYRLRAIRSVLRARRDRPSRNDLAYAIYMGLMLAVITGAPVVRAAVLWLAEVLPSRGDDHMFGLVVALVAVVAMVLLLAGTYAGPIRASLPEIDLVLTTALPRRLLLGGRVVRAFVLAAFAGVALAALFAAARFLRDDLTLLVTVALLGLGVAAGLVGALLMTLGQLRRGFGWEMMRAEAQRRDAVSTLALTGDLRGATTRIGAPVTVGRNWRWRPWRSGRHTILSRDLIGVARTPARSLAALIGMAAAAALLGAFGSPTGGHESPAAAAVVGAVSLVVAYAAIGPWCRGLRTAGESVGQPPLLPFSSEGMLFRHLVAPGLLTVIVAGACATFTAAIFGSTVVPAAFAGVVFGVIALALRLHGALKGPLPQSLLAPVPTPVGDMAGINVTVWSLDGLIWALLIGGSLAALAVWSLLAAMVFAALSLIGLVAGSMTRLRAAQRL